MRKHFTLDKSIPHMTKLIQNQDHNHNHNRYLNEAWENAKDTASNTYDGLKRTVTDNMILSIVIASVVIALLILCCYLRRKYSRNVAILSRKEYKELQKKVQARGDLRNQRREGQELERDENYTAKKGQNDEKNSLRALERRMRDRKKRKKKRVSDGNAEMNNNDSAAVAANTSMETNGTLLSNEEIGYTEDIESGGQGFEIGISPSPPLSPVRAQKGNSFDAENHDLALAGPPQFDEEIANGSDDKDESSKTEGRGLKGFFSGRKKKERQGSF